MSDQAPAPRPLFLALSLLLLFLLSCVLNRRGMLERRLGRGALPTVVLELETCVALDRSSAIRLHCRLCSPHVGPLSNAL